MRECLPGTSFHQNSILLFPKCGDRTSQGHAKLLDSGTVREIGFRFLFNIVCLIQIIVLTTSFLSQRKRGRCRNSSRSGLWSKSHLPEFHKEGVIWWDNVMITTKDICLGTVRRTVLLYSHTSTLLADSVYDQALLLKHCGHFSDLTHKAFTRPLLSTPQPHPPPPKLKIKGEEWALHSWKLKWRD